MAKKKRAFARRGAPAASAAPDPAPPAPYPGRLIGPHELRNLGLASARLRTRGGT